MPIYGSSGIILIIPVNMQSLEILDKQPLNYNQYVGMPNLSHIKNHCKSRTLKLWTR
jgi:hypothetical protein